ncbi:Transaldolase [Grifola frondosa]|uniref:Transaldolase n=1 Tax=Grifola frondosa TaxID=5627 RepID=A0A1C7MTQ7_GRIFR|nr:Transaldolase [Grifola frondosa]
MASQSLLSLVRSQVVVDVDSMDPKVAERHTTETERFCDMTSNQAIVYSEAIKPARAAILQTACGHAGTSADLETRVADVLDLLTVSYATKVFPYLTGRVHAQTSPAFAYDAEATIAHAKRLVLLFELNNIPNSRVCIKIPATPQSIIACQELERIGIRTLATCLFSVPQAVAASQAGCLYVAPYFNELRVHFEPGVWKGYRNAAKEHPMASVISDIVKVYKKIGSKTLVMPASIVSAAEVLALVSLHPDHLTLSGAVLDQLASFQSTDALPVDGLQSHQSGVPFTAQSTENNLSNSSGLNVWETDFLANGADALRQALAADAEATRKLDDALKIFGEMEERAKVLIRAELLRNSSGASA